MEREIKREREREKERGREKKRRKEEVKKKQTLGSQPCDARGEGETKGVLKKQEKRRIHTSFSAAFAARLCN